MCFIYTLFYYIRELNCLVLRSTKKTGRPPAGQNGCDKTGKLKKTDSEDALRSSGKAAKNPADTVLQKPAVSSFTSNAKAVKRIIFQVRFHTEFGQEVFLLGDHPLLGDGQPEQALPMQYFDEAHWYAVLDLSADQLTDQNITYNYILRNADGTYRYDWGTDKTFNPARIGSAELVCIDTWNHAGYFENSFYTEPFRQVLLKDKQTVVTVPAVPDRTHTLRVKTPLLEQGQTLCVLGSCETLGNWETGKALPMGRREDDEAFELTLDLSSESFPIAYKYGVYDIQSKKFLYWEDGNNRVLHDSGKPDRQTILHDGWVVLPANTWKGAGIAIPVFSLRSEKSFGVGEFSDLHLLVDWAKQTGLKMIQLLPVNDTTATHSWLDSYPYAAISAFALHPIYLNLEKLPGSTAQQLQSIEKERKRLNALDVVDYEAVAKIKWDYVTELYQHNNGKFLKEAAYQSYFERNQHWLVPYAAFCYLRDQYGTVDFSKWPAFNVYDAEEIVALTDPASAVFSEIALHYFIQYQLHLQLREATAYAHANGTIVKGDIAIGVYRHGVDAWQAPELYHMGFQAGAPPDDFAVKGQNWGFPTYNWQRMREDGYGWWKQRFAQMSDYFDAFRIDHILGFFRIWSIPMDAVEGIMGYFVPAIPVHIREFHSRQITFDHYRYAKPYITENVLWEVFKYDNELVKSLFLEKDGPDNYALKPAFRTQRMVEAHFQSLEQDEFHARIQQGLYDLISNVLVFEAEQRDNQHFHFRFGMEQTTSFRNLDADTQQQLRELYNDYFFRRQDDFWMKESLQKLPALKRVTNMLVCGEDLGLVPSCVPDVMKQLGLLSLEIQRMPKDPRTEFFHPSTAPYLSVVTPSTHDMSTIRGWWEEDRERIQHFYNNELGQPGEAPVYCEPWINRAILLQHLQSPAMWSVFQLQDLLGMDENLRRENPAEERINIPANPKHYWQYRMHMTIEALMQAEAFNSDLKQMVLAGGR
jgi:4-alpha-glucanotransferase